MAGQRQVDERGDGQESAGKALKRRGILAAAGAVVAGIVAKQTSQSVAAISGTGGDGTLVLGSNSTNNTANYASLRTEVVSGMNFHGPVLFDCNVSPFESSGDTNAIGISGTSRGTAAGVYGTDVPGGKPSGYPQGMNAGVYGYTNAQGHSGVRGDGGSSGMGVSGISANSNAILGTTLGSPSNANAAILGLGYTCGVEGDVSAGSTVANSIAVKGVNSSTGAAGWGVEGLIPFTTNAANTIGVLGLNQSSGSGGVGVRGDCANGSGVLGIQFTAIPGTAEAFGATAISNGTGVAGQVFGASTSGAAAFVGSAPAGNFAAFFTGDVHITGKLVVSDPSYKSGMVKHATDGTNRLVYCVESPESWIEDVGTGTLTNGKATVTFDKDFAAVVHTDSYHVFLTEYAETQGLYVSGRTDSGFTVQERNKGGASGAFSWKVMAKARSVVKSERLARYTPPTIKLPDKPLFDLIPSASPKKP